jgi:uncharacterized membrane protein
VKQFWAILFTVIFAAYPVLIYLGLTRFRPSTLGLIVLVVIALRMAVLAGLDWNQWKKFLPMFASVTAVAIVSALFDSGTSLLLAPVLINGALLVTFGLTLKNGPSMIERFASLKEKNITPRISRYCFRVTVVWCVFFALNGAVSAATVFWTPREYWVLYNGLISYILIALLLIGEVMVRKRVAARDKQIETDQAP